MKELYNLQHLEALYAMLPEGKGNAITLEAVCELWQMSERKARDAMHVMLKKNHDPVLNLFSGYFRPKTEEELDKYIDISMSYKRSHEIKCYHLRRCKDEFSNRKMDYSAMA